MYHWFTEVKKVNMASGTAMRWGCLRPSRAATRAGAACTP